MRVRRIVAASIVAAAALFIGTGTAFAADNQSGDSPGGDITHLLGTVVHDVISDI